MKDLIFEVLEEMSFDFGRNNEELLQNLGFDSIKTLELVVMLEERLDIAFEDDDLIPSNFVQVRNIIDLVMSKKGV